MTDRTFVLSRSLIELDLIFTDFNLGMDSRSKVHPSCLSSPNSFSFHTIPVRFLDSVGSVQTGSGLVDGSKKTNKHKCDP